MTNLLVVFMDECFHISSAKAEMWEVFEMGSNSLLVLKICLPSNRLLFFSQNYKLHCMVPAVYIFQCFFSFQYSCGTRTHKQRPYIVTSSENAYPHGKHGQMPVDQHAGLDFYSASSLKQQSAGRHVAPLGHIILIPHQPVFALSS